MFPVCPQTWRFPAPGLTPEFVSDDMAYSPMFRYPWQATVEALTAMPRGEDDCRTLRYTNPATGGAALTTIDCYALGLDKDRATRPYRTNSSAVCVVVDGEGSTEVGDTILTWRENDVFALPHGSWISHTAASEDTRIFQVNDREMLNRMGILREEFRG